MALAGTSATLIAASLRIRGRVPFALAVLLVAGALIVVESVALSLMQAYSAWWVLLAGTIALVGAAALWRQQGRPPPPALGRLGRARVGALCRRQPALAVLAGLVVLALAMQAFMAVAVAPNEADTLLYHLPRAATWLQHHSVLQFEHGLNDPEVSDPPDAEILLAWTMGLARSDRFTQLIQWIALIGLTGAVFSIARVIGFRRSAAAWAAGLFALLPEPLVEASTDQNDLVVTFFLLAAGFFVVRGLRDRKRGDIAVGAIASGLAVGTKFTVVFALPGALLVLAASLRAYRPPRPLVTLAFVLIVAALFVLGSFNYLENLVHTGTPTGFSGNATGGDFIKSSPLLDAGRVGWDLVDAPGLPQPAWLSHTADDLVRPLFAGVHGSFFSRPDPAIRTEIIEDETAYGLIGLLLVLPLLVYSAARPRERPMRRLLAIAALLYFPMYTLTLGYTPEAARYLMPMVALGAPLLAATSKPRWIAWPVLALAVATLPATLLHNTDKPVLPDESGRSIFDRDRLDQQTIDPDLASIASPIRRLRHLVGPHATLGFLRQDDLRDYLLLGQPLQRKLIAFDMPDITPANLRATHVHGVFIGYASPPGCRQPTCARPPGGLQALRLGPRSYLVLPSPQPR